MSSKQFMLVLALILYLVLRKAIKNDLYSKLVFANLFLSISLNMLFKIIFHREFPEVSKLAEFSGLSYPNSHSMVGLSFYGLLLYFCYTKINSKHLKYTSVAFITSLILLIGAARIYLGVKSETSLRDAVN